MYAATSVKQLINFLLPRKPIPVYSLALVRIAFGLIHLWATIHFLCYDRIKYQYVMPKVFFNYPIVPFAVMPGSEAMMWALHIVMAFACIAIALGVYYRTALIVYGSVYTYFFLIDSTYYNNHYYLSILLCVLFCFIDADQVLNVSTRRQPVMYVPEWQLAILRWQILIVYLFTGLTKFQQDWLSGRIAMGFREIWMEKGLAISNPALAYVIGQDLFPYVFSYGGIIVDLGAAFLLVSRFRRGRYAMLIITSMFHLANSQLFNIGTFPWLMLAINLLFVDPYFFLKFFKSPASLNTKSKIKLASDVNVSAPSRLQTYLLILYFSIQIALPLRIYSYQGPATWTMDGHLFSWLVMGHNKKLISLVIWVVDPATGVKTEIHPFEYMTETQAFNFAIYPTHAVIYAKWLKEEVKKRGIINARILVECWVTFNGREKQLYFDPQMDMSSVELSVFKANNFMRPLLNYP